MIIKRITAMLLTLAVVLCFSACGIKNSGAKTTSPDDIPDSTEGKDLVPAAAADSVFSLNSNSNYSFNPLTATNHSNQLICSLVYENILELDNDFNIIEGASIVTVMEHSEDYKQWIFTLAEDHVFHDGSSVSCKDLRYSLERAIYCDRYAGRFNSINGVSASNGKLYVSLTLANSQFPKLLNIPIIKYGTNGDAFPIGSGPYTYSEDRTKLLAYEGYPGYADLPLKTIYIREYTAAADAIAAYEDSIIDIVQNDPSSYSNLGYASNNEMHSFATTNMHYVAFNTESMLGKYPGILFAMNYAFDRDYLVELLGGNAVASSVPMYPSCECYPHAFAQSLSYDMEKCKVILENAGVSDSNSDGLLEINGITADLTLDFVVCSDSSAKSGVAYRFAEDMTAIGIPVKVRTLSWTNYLKALEDGDYDLYYGEVKLRNDFDITELLQVRTDDNEGSNLNYTNSTDDSYVDYIRAYLGASDLDREMRYQAFCEYLANSGLIVTIGFEKQQVISHRAIINGLNPNAGNPLYDFQHWKINLSD